MLKHFSSITFSLSCSHVSFVVMSQLLSYWLCDTRGSAFVYLGAIALPIGQQQHSQCRVFLLLIMCEHQNHLTFFDLCYINSMSGEE